MSDTFNQTTYHVYVRKTEHDEWETFVICHSPSELLEFAWEFRKYNQYKIRKKVVRETDETDHFNKKWGI